MKILSGGTILEGKRFAYSVPVCHVHCTSHVHHTAATDGETSPNDVMHG
jgi:hypothetical protein